MTSESGEAPQATAAPRFAQKVVIVTGAGSGIGREVALSFAREGAHVVASDIEESSAAETARLIETGGGVAKANVADASRTEPVEAMIADAVATFGGIDILYNNAYWAPINHALLETSDGMWDRVVDTTLKSVFLCSRAAIPHMIERGGGVVVNAASTAGVVASPRFAAYSAAKGGVIALTRSIAFDYGDQGIRCNAVAPGLVRTPATDPVFADPERTEWLTSRIIVGRAGLPDDIARAVLFLASSEASFITGQTILVDGGRSIA